MIFLKSIKLKNLTIKNNIIVAPLSGYTFLPTRLIYRKQGEVLLYTEMVSAEGLNHNFEKSAELLITESNDKPLGVQIFGPNAEKILNSFKLIKSFRYDIVDINCGCSVKKVLKSKSGAYLLNNPDEIYKIIKSLKNETDKPVSLKIRSGYESTSKNYIEVLESAEKGGADLITLHPRTRAMLFSGKADWKCIKEMKQKSAIPVIGNGDIFTGEDAVRMIRETGCDGVMIARGLIENPFLIEEIFSAFKGETYIPPTLEKRIDRLLEHCYSLVKFFGENKGIREFRKFIRGYLHSLEGISIVRKNLSEVNKFSDFERIVDEYGKR